MTYLPSGCCPEERKLTSQSPSISVKFSIQYRLIITFVIYLTTEKCQRFCFAGEFLLEEARKLFREIVSAFDKVVLPIYQVNHVQFALFYLCSFKQVCDQAV